LERKNIAHQGDPQLWGGGVGFILNTSKQNDGRQSGKLIRLLGYLAKHLVKSLLTAKGPKEKKRVLARVLPDFELAAVLTIYYKTHKEVADMLLAAIATEDDFVTITDFVHGFYAWHKKKPDGDTTETDNHEVTYAAGKESAG
jgi:hypothetical protein